jgi:hypothetical protein
MTRLPPKQLAECLLAANSRVGASIMSGLVLYLFSKCPSHRHELLGRLAGLLKFLTKERMRRAEENGMLDICTVPSTESRQVRGVLASSKSPAKLYFRLCLDLEGLITSALVAYDRLETRHSYAAMVSLVECSEQVRVLREQFSGFHGLPPVNEEFMDSLSNEILGVQPLDFEKAVDDLDKAVQHWFMGVVARDTSVR